MKLLVLGSEGQIGKPFCEYALSKGDKVIRWDKKIDPNTMDLSKEDQVSKLYYTASNVDAIVFLAFEVGGSKYLKNKDSTFTFISENVRIMENVFRMLAVTLKRTLFASSQMSNMHHTNYGFLKDLGERYCRVLKQSYCRFWNVYGHEDPKDDKSHVITDLIYSGLTKGKIEVMTNGEEHRQFLFVDDCSKALYDWCHEVIPLDTFDVTSFSWVKIKELAHLISDRLAAQGITAPVSFTSTPDPLAQTTNEPNQESLLHWSPRYTLREGIDKIIEAQRALLASSPAIH